MKNGSKGLTITEYILMIVLFTFLSLMAFPMYVVYVNSERKKLAVHEMNDIIAPALQRLYEDTGSFPPSKYGDDPDLAKNEDGLTKWQGPYLKSWLHGPVGWAPKDGNGAYQYRNFYYGGYHMVVLWCYGLNRSPETDITTNTPSQGDDIVIYLLHTRT